VVAARAGEHWACEALYRRHVATVHGLACRLLGRDSDVDDILQDTFITAFATLDRLEEPGAFRSWVCGMAVRKTCKLIRRRRLLSRLGLRRREEPIDFDRLRGRSAPPEVVLELRAIYQVLTELPADVRAALVLRKIEGASLEETAQMLGCSLATAKRRIARGEAVLRQVGPRQEERGEET
jgi:RNA polymerase sigma-70 factor (ECF subfamily)